MESEFITMISNVGFPIVITLYSLTRLEKTVKENTNAIKSILSLVKSKI